MGVSRIYLVTIVLEFPVLADPGGQGGLSATNIVMLAMPAISLPILVDPVVVTFLHKTDVAKKIMSSVISQP